MSRAGTRERTNEEIVEEIRAGINVRENMAQLYEQNKNLMRMYARKYIQDAADESTLQEYMSEGYFALVKACENYRQETGTKFITLLGYALRSRFGWFCDYNRTVRLPGYVSNIWKKCNRVKDLLYANTGKIPSADEVISAAGLEYGEAESYRAALQTRDIRSLNEPLTSDDGHELDLMQCIADDFDVEESVSDREHNENLRSVWDILPRYLTDKELDVIILYYREGLSLEKIAQKKGITYQGVNYTRRRALAKLANCQEMAELFA